MAVTRELGQKPIRLGVIGCGNVLSAYRTTIERLSSEGSAEAIIACGREAQKEEALRFLRVQEFTTDATQVIHSPDVDLIVILTSTPQHAALAKAALEAGKNVLLEKPLATNLEDANAVVESARHSKGYLACAPFTILSPTFQTLARRINAGDIGRPCLARARYGWSGPWWSEWFYKPGGGALFDLGVYCFTTLTGLLGPVLAVSAMAGVAIPEREINGRKIAVEAEDNAQVLLDFGNSCFAVITSGFSMQQYRNPAVEIYGTTGTIQMLGDDWDPEGYELWQNAAGAWQVFKETEPDWSWTAGLPHLVHCIRTGQRPLVTPDHARHVLELMLAAQQSARDRRQIPIQTTFSRPDFLESKTAEPAHLVHDRARTHD